MPIINVQILSGRTAAQKRELIAELAHATQHALGVPEEAIRITITELPPENWGCGDRTMADIRARPVPSHTP